jgi:hypothetical protein
LGRIQNENDPWGIRSFGCHHSIDFFNKKIQIKIIPALFQGAGIFYIYIIGNIWRPIYQTIQKSLHFSKAQGYFLAGIDLSIQSNNHYAQLIQACNHNFEI